MVTALLLPIAALADVGGKPVVIDAATLDIAGERVRLDGIEAPGFRETCPAGGDRWHCGMEAASALAFLIARSWVSCVERGRDPQGRLVAACYAGGPGGPDLALRLLHAGWARTGPRASDAYRAAEAEARRARKGLWREARPRGG